jgi:hypothetical protein
MFTFNSRLAQKGFTASSDQNQKVPTFFLNAKFKLFIFKIQVGTMRNMDLTVSIIITTAVRA